MTGVMFIKSNVELSEHALLQIGYRGISIQEIINCIDEPDSTVQQPSGRFQAIKKHVRQNKTYLLIVVYEKQSNQIVVITAFITSKVNKYL